MSKPKKPPPRLADLDMSPRLGRKAYREDLARLQLALSKIQQSYLFSGDKAVILFEGWDAAGKGGTIRRISAALDPRSFKVWPIGAPRNFYLDRHYLLRFMERLPPNGAISAFDRSWYGRVLVERVEELTPKKRWRQAYREIRDFEQMLVDDGTRLVKLFFHITPDVQLKRFEERLRNPLKRWKLTYEDFRNRDRWAEYSAAIDDMLDKTSTAHAPWTLIPSNDKKYARVFAIEAIVATLSRGIDLDPIQPHEKVLDAAGDVLGIEPDLIASLRGRTE
jgi:polyphosphate kinase 2 (PPK2 family)